MLEHRYATIDDAAFITKTQSLEEVQTYVGPASESEIAGIIDDPDQAFLLGLNGEGLPVGFAHLRGLRNPSRSLEIFRLAVAETNKGYGSALLKTVMNEAFNVLDANRLWLDVFPQNNRARKVYQRCGFVEEGMLREVYYWQGKFQSTIIMSVLAKEYACCSDTLK